MSKVPIFREEHLEAISRVLADTEAGLTGAEIGRVLTKCRIADPTPDMTKWKRLYNALVTEQNKRQYGNHVVGFICKAMRPVLHAEVPDYFDSKQAELNRVLAFSGLELGDDGRVHRVRKVTTISEAEEHAGRLRKRLESRGVHADVPKFCKAEFLQKNYFHAVLEATKSVVNKIRAKSGLTTDGAELATQAFALAKTGKPLLAINPLRTETEKGEQRGFTNLLVGLFGTFRNPTAHAEKIYWPIDEQDALDILSLISLVHRKLDSARRI